MFYYIFNIFYSSLTIWGILPSHVTDCGDDWFSKITDPNVNAIEICLGLGYSGTITEYGGNRGIQCKHSNTKSGGSLDNFGRTVSWKCAGKSYVAEQLQ